jgi:hypothetical protein
MLTLEALLSDSSKDLRDDILTVHPWVLNATTSGGLQLLRLTFSYGSRTVFSWVPSPEDHIRDDLAQVISKIDALGGTLVVDELSYTVPDIEDYVSILLNRADQDMLTGLATHHADEASNAYTEGDMPQAWKEASFALRFILKGEDANNVGYIHLANGRFQEATQLFEQCLQAKEIEDDSAALAMYNRILTRLMGAQPQDLLNEVDSTQERLEAVTGQKYRCRCLFVPTINGSHCVLVEEADAELSVVMAAAREAFSTMETTISTVDVKLAEWPVQQN